MPQTVFDPVAQTVTIQQPTPVPQVIAATDYISNLQAEIDLHTNNISTLQIQQQESDANFVAQIAAEQALLDSANADMATATAPTALNIPDVAAFLAPPIPAPITLAPAQT